MRGTWHPCCCGPTGRLGEPPGRGLPLGIDALPAYEDLELELGPGDLLVGFTDGLVEARREGEMFGLERLGPGRLRGGRGTAGRCQRWCSSYTSGCANGRTA